MIRLSLRPQIAGATAALSVAAVATQALGWSASPLETVRTALGLAWLAYAGGVTVLAVGSGALRRVDGSPVATAGVFTVQQVVARGVMTSFAAFPRFVRDPAAHLVASFWLVLILSCGYVFLEPLLSPRYRRLYWVIAALLVLPWGLGVSPTWPVVDG